MDVSSLLKNLDNYIEKCFIDAFRLEEKEYNRKHWSFEYILIDNKKGSVQMYVIPECKFEKVLQRVMFRIERNLFKNFGVTFGNSDSFRALLYTKYFQIDPDFTVAMFTTKDGNYISVSIFDDKINNLIGKGECVPGYRYEKLLFQYWDIDSDTFDTLPEGDEKRTLPNEIKSDWNVFIDLYIKTFGNTPDNIIGYDFICSSGLKKI